MSSVFHQELTPRQAEESAQVTPEKKPQPSFWPGKPRDFCADFFVLTVDGWLDFLDVFTFCYFVQQIDSFKTGDSM